MTRVIALLLSFTVMAVPARASGIIAFFGASETSGYGLKSPALAFPYVVVRTCHVKARINAVSNVPLTRRLPHHGSADANVIFLSAFDAREPHDDNALADWLAGFGHEKTLVIEAPLVSEMGMNDAGLSQMQIAFREKISHIAESRGIEVLTLTVPPHFQAYLQPDGLHPNAAGARLIGDQVTAWLWHHDACAR